jgi:hypothetical protein
VLLKIFVLANKIFLLFLTIFYVLSPPPPPPEYEEMFFGIPSVCMYKENFKSLDKFTALRLTAAGAPPGACEFCR